MTYEPVLGQINLVVRDMDAAVAFYRHLGLTIDAGPGAVHASSRLPNGMLLEWDSVEFVPHWDSGWAGSTGGSAVIGFSVTTPEAVDRIYAELTGAGHEGHQQPDDAFRGSRYAIIDDPDGDSVGIMGPEEPERKSWPPTPPPHGS
ncbi:glyoxalase [Arthrobacter livingstonensis]|uniref:Glyoxalase n=1 Tax=Arthrobacter livingstonensis TaxID=670078 RepID=A0A2V5L2A8_9MICC|nr:VOC family protein [Arthrobacter livingstonensis]PYI65481.1 glyoxalase [Arthrobacter livingstonensis]